MQSISEGLFPEGSLSLQVTDMNEAWLEFTRRHDKNASLEVWQSQKWAVMDFPFFRSSCKLSGLWDLQPPRPPMLSVFKRTHQQGKKGKYCRLTAHTHLVYSTEW